MLTLFSSYCDLLWSILACFLLVKRAHLLLVTLVPSGRIVILKLFLTTQGLVMIIVDKVEKLSMDQLLWRT